MIATIGKLFGKSPFGPLQEHMVIVKECVDLIIPFFEAVIKKENAIKDEAKSFSEKVFNESTNTFAKFLIKNNSFTKAEILSLKKIIKEKEKEINK